MFPKERALVSFVVCLALGVTAEAACVNQPLSIPSTVNDEVTLSSCISSSDYYNKYELTNLEKARRLRFTVTKITLPQILIRLERAGSLVLQSSDYSKSTLTMDVEIPANATYTLVVKAITAGSIGKYTLSVSDLNDPYAAAQIVPIVGRLVGLGGAVFRSDLKLHNTSTAKIDGTIIITPRNQSAGTTDAQVPFSVPAGGVVFYEDVYGTLMNANGAARLAIVPANGASGLIVDTSTYTALADGGELGQSPTVFRADEFVKGPATMVSVTGKASERSNLFIMTGNTETTILWTLSDANGVQIRTATAKYAPNATFQTSVADVTGVPVPPNSVLRAEISLGGEARLAMNPVHNVSNQGRWLDFKALP